MQGSERNHWERFWRKGRQRGEIYSTGGRILEALEPVFDPRGKVVLEIGAGTGRDSLELAKQGALVVTLDYARSAVEMIRRQVEEADVRLGVVLGDALAMPFRKGAFDLVFHQGLLEHFRDPLPLLKNNVEALKPGGLLLVDVPQRYHLYTLAKHILIWLKAWFAGWETEFTIGRLESLLRQAGLEPVRRYGDWMRPSFAYRGLRELMRRIGIHLPMYPRGIPWFRDIRATIRAWCRSRAWSYYTYLDIGVIARKPEVARHAQLAQQRNQVVACVQPGDV